MLRCTQIFNEGSALRAARVGTAHFFLKETCLATLMPHMKALKRDYSSSRTKRSKIDQVCQTVRQLVACSPSNFVADICHPGKDNKLTI